MAANVVFPTEGQGFRAEVRIGDEIQLVLIVTHTAVGPVVGIYEAKAKKWRDRQWAEDIDDGKAKASATARNWWYRNIGRKEPFPPLDWQATG